MIFVHICIWHEHLDHCMQDGTRVDFHSSSCTKKSSLVDWRAVVWVHNRSDPKLAHHYLQFKEWQDIACKMLLFLGLFMKPIKLLMWYKELKLLNVHEDWPQVHFAWIPEDSLQAGWDPGGFPQFALHQVIQLGWFESAGMGTQEECWFCASVTTAIIRQLNKV